MTGVVETIVETIIANNNIYGMSIIFISGLIEYIFPPYPADTVTVLGAVLITARDWSFFTVFTASTLGSIVGAIIDFYIGKYIHRKSHPDRLKHERSRKLLHIVDNLVEKFKKHGEIYLIINRFVPAIRSFFFIAAGIAGMRPYRVIIFAAISAAAWNLLLILLGALIGYNLDELVFLLKHYTIVAYCIFSLIGIVLFIRWLKKRREEKSTV